MERRERLDVGHAPKVPPPAASPVIAGGRASISGHVGRRQVRRRRQARMLPYALIGAGPAGLAAARNLARRGIPFVGFERTHRSRWAVGHRQPDQHDVRVGSPDLVQDHHGLRRVPDARRSRRLPQPLGDAHVLQRLRRHLRPASPLPLRHHRGPGRAERGPQRDLGGDESRTRRQEVDARPIAG